VAVRLTHQVVQTVKLPVIGIGGIFRALDALEFLIVGARAVQVGTANFVDPQVMSQIIEDLETFCIEEGVEDINDLIGTLKT
jgi:dihydroorotate dehydrogenase (NAD+) catalytic subunit